MFVSLVLIFFRVLEDRLNRFQKKKHCAIYVNLVRRKLNSILVIWYLKIRLNDDLGRSRIWNRAKWDTFL